MSVAIVSMIEPDGTLRYDCGHDIAIRVALHRKNGHRTYPVEVLHQGAVLLSTDTNLRQLHAIESLRVHADALHKHPDWHAILTAIASELPEKATAPWKPVGQPLSAYTMTPRDYLWYPWLLKGEPCSLEGDPNVGKTSVLLKLLAHLTTGTPFPTLFPERPDAPFDPATVVLFTNEDSPGKTLLPRLILNGGNADRVIFMEGKQDPDTGQTLLMSLQDLDLLEQILVAHHPAMLCFDPLQSYLGPGVDMNNAAHTRPLLGAVAALCAKHDCTPLYIRHNGKTQRTKAIHSALGSIDISAHMRSILTLYRDSDIRDRRILAHTRPGGIPAPSMQITFTGAAFDYETNQGTETIEDVRLHWDGTSTLTSEDLNMRETLHDNDPEETTSALEDARGFLQEMLKEGSQPVEALFAEAKQAGIKRRTLERAKTKERLVARRVQDATMPSNKWRWEWTYPTGQRSTP